MIQSTPSEREYFKHLLNLLDQNYMDWVALQHKNMRDFLERSQEQVGTELACTMMNCRAERLLIFTTSPAVKSFVQLAPPSLTSACIARSCWLYSCPCPCPAFGLPVRHAPFVCTQMLDNMRFLAKFLATVFQILCCLRIRRRKVNQFNANANQLQHQQEQVKRRRFSWFGRRKRALEEVRKKETPSGSKQADEEDDDLVEAYLRARTAQQEHAGAGQWRSARSLSVQ